MSTEAMRWSRRQKIASPAMKNVLNALAYLHRRGAELFPSQEYLAGETGMSVRAVRDALRILEHFGVVRRQARSRGAYGRLSDRFDLALKNEFTLSRDAIAAARKGLRTEASNRHKLPVGAVKSQPAKNVIATGSVCRGIEGDQKNLSQERNSTCGEVGYLRTREGWSVVAGGRS